MVITITITVSCSVQLLITTATGCNCIVLISVIQDEALHSNPAILALPPLFHVLSRSVRVTSMLLLARTTVRKPLNRGLQNVLGLRGLHSPKLAWQWRAAPLKLSTVKGLCGLPC